MRRRQALFLAALLAASAPAWGTTYYVRVDGGTDQQCNGQSDAPYPGSGAGQPCAWSHPFYALTGGGAWKLLGGDTLVVGPGAYRMGYGAPNTAWCDAGGSWDCRLPPLPSGSAATPTRLLGKGWDAGCAAAPQLWGAERADSVLDLSGTSNALLACLEVTDRAGCAEFHATPSVACQRDTAPYGDWASMGLYADNSSNVTLRDLDLHGLASQGVRAGRLSNWTVERVRIAGNGAAGWDGDLGGPSSNSGTLTFRQLTVEWNGCVETWPGLGYDHCWAQEAGGYGDGLGTASTGGQWVFEDSLFRYNTSDGLDLLYLGVGGQAGATVSVRRTVAHSNAGNQLKLADTAEVSNSLVVGDCAYFAGRPIATLMAESDHCRALGASLEFSPHAGDSASLVNSTVVGQGDCLLLVECETANCTGSETAQVQNSILRGYVDWRQPWENACLVWDPSSFTTGRIDWNTIHNVKDDEGRCATGPHNTCNLEPLFANASLGPAFDGHLQAGSPALDTGLPVGALGGLVPAADLEGQPRPQGAGVDRGAYERPGALCSLPKGDFSGDGRPDLLWRHLPSNRNMLWVMNGTAAVSSAWISPDPPAATWQIAGADDFLVDGRSDLVLADSASGALQFWAMNGATRVGAATGLSGASPPAPPWKLSATGDFDRDGRPDLLFRNFATQKIEVWTLDGTQRTGVLVPTPDQAVNVNWEVAAALDYDGDGHRDLLWYNWSSGKIVTWYLNAGLQRTAGQFTTPASAGNANWKVLAGGDYSPSGASPACANDIVWRNATSGRSVVWQMDAASTRLTGDFTSPDGPAADPSGTPTPRTDWTVAGPR